MIETGNWSPLKVKRGVLIEYTLDPTPLVLAFDFNPTSITRTRKVNVKSGGAPGTEGGYDFTTPAEAQRASQGVSVEAESLSLKILLDATDRMNAGDRLASTQGIQPEIDVIFTMLEPRSQMPRGVQTLAALGQGKSRAFSRREFASVMLFKWGLQVLPVFVTDAELEIKAYLPNLFPYRAEATLSLQVIESNNPIFELERKRRVLSAVSHVANVARSTLGVPGL